MVDPIELEDIKRRSQIKQFQQYQNHLDELDASEKDKPGEMQGKKVKKIEQADTPVKKDLFKTLHKKT